MPIKTTYLAAQMRLGSVDVVTASCNKAIDYSIDERCNGTTFLLHTQTTQLGVLSESGTQHP